MSPFFQCSACMKVAELTQDKRICSFCGSNQGQIISDERFWERHDKGSIVLIDPASGKPVKKKKK